MTQIIIHLERGPDGQPAGQLTTGTGHVVAFTGWLHLIRLLEDQLAQAPQQPGATPQPPQPGPNDQTTPGQPAPGSAAQPAPAAGNTPPARTQAAAAGTPAAPPACQASGNHPGPGA
jgi:hypothetical protein